VIESNSLFDDPAAAKAHISDKALRYIRREWPRNGLPGSYGGSLGPTFTNANGDDLGRRQDELRQLLKRRQQAKSTEPRHNGPPESSCVDMTDPAQARAFVEGFHVGHLAGLREAAGSGSSPPSIPQSRRRSRSPGRGRSASPSRADGKYRHRSPIHGATKASRSAPSPPRYFDGSRHGKSMQATFPSCSSFY
jgi:hypothetical protein